MSDSSDTSPPGSSADERVPKPSRLLWWLHPKVALPLTLFGLILFSPFMYRAHRIASVPDIGDPFDVEAFGTVDIAPEDNAMTQYVAAAGLYKDVFFGSETLEKAYTHGWSQTSEFLRWWLHKSQPALSEWRKGTERSQAVLIQPKDSRFDDTPLDVFQRARGFACLARLQAEHCAYDGDLEAAWGWLLAAVRFSRHVQQNCGLNQRLTGIAAFHDTAGGIDHWAANPAVTIDMLRKALTEFREADRLTPVNSFTLKTEYVALRNTLKDPDAFYACIGDGRDSWEFHSSSLFVMGEPEQSLRVFQHVFRNQLSEIDKPKQDRAPIAGGTLHLYELPPGAESSLPARELERVFHSAYLANMFLPAYSEADIAMQRESARRAALSLVLAGQLYHRLHGDWPAKVADLVPEILAESPADPLGKSGELMRLRRDGDELVIYSVGTNGRDDGGSIDRPLSTNSDDRPDEGYRLKRPLKHETSTTQDDVKQEKR